jgi:lipoate-protein ligase B
MTDWPVCQVQRLGMLAYREATNYTQLAQRAADEIPDTLLLLNAAHLYAGALRSYWNLLWDEAERAARGPTLHWVDRGGDITITGQDNWWGIRL